MAEKNPHPPRPLAMVLCDNAALDPTTRKFNILGTFDRVQAKVFPVGVQVTTYVAITDCRGKSSLQIRLSRINPEEGEEEDLVGVGMEIESADPLEVVQFAPVFQGVLDKPGVYYLGLWTTAEDKPIEKIIERRFVVEEIK